MAPMAKQTNNTTNSIETDDDENIVDNVEDAERFHAITNIQFLNLFSNFMTSRLNNGAYFFWLTAVLPIQKK